MKLTVKQIIAMKDIQKCCDAGIGGIGKSLEPSDIHGLCETALEQHAEIEILNEQAEIDKDFIKQYQDEVKGLKARLGAAEMVVEALRFYANENNYMNDSVDIGVGNQPIPDSSFIMAHDCGQGARDTLRDYEKTKAGAGSAARNLQAEKFKPAVISLKPLTADRADGEETSRRVDVGSEQDSGFTSPATPQACTPSEKLNMPCPKCKSTEYVSLYVCRDCGIEHGCTRCITERMADTLSLCLATTIFGCHGLTRLIKTCPTCRPDLYVTRPDGEEEDCLDDNS